MCNTAYNLKGVYSSLVFLNFGHPFAVTSCTQIKQHELKIWGPLLPASPPPLAYTLVYSGYVIASKLHFTIHATAVLVVIKKLLVNQNIRFS